MRELFFVIGPKAICIHLIFIGCIILYFLFSFKISYYPSENSIAVFTKHFSTIASLRKCLNLAYDQKINDTNYIENYRSCVKAFTNNLKLDSFFMGRLGEFKKFFPLNPSYPRKKCKWLTVGIGGTVEAEKEFKEKYSDCQLFGVEPSHDQYFGFDQYGTVIPYGAGVISGKFKLTIRENSTYINKTMPALAMSEILDKHLQTRTVLYMTIDIEGFEYSILRELMAGKILDKEGISFCQIDAELHNFKQNKTPTIELLHNFNSHTSNYLPIYTDGFLIHEKVTWINIKNRECRKAFNFDMFL